MKLQTQFRCVVVGALFGISAVASLAQPTPAPSVEVDYRLDSGLIPDAQPNAGLGVEAELTWFAEVSVRDSAWMRVHFGASTMLAGQDRHEGGSYLVITSIEDGAQHFLDATTLPEWDSISAFQNGDTFIVELYATPGMGDNRVTIEKVTSGLQAGLEESICGPTDDRVPYNDPRAGRLSTGCTGWLISRNGASNEFLTAGHCISNGSVGRVMLFNVPAATAGGGFVAPPPEFQFPVQSASIQSVNNAAVGEEYARFNTSNNSNTGLSARIAQGRGAYVLASSAPAGGTATTTVRGNGIVNDQAGIVPVPPQWNRINKTASGPYAGRTGNRIDYETDTDNANSGSPVTQRIGFPLAFERAIGIHTDGGCTATGGTNKGTAIDHPGLQGFLNSPQGDPVPYESNVSKGLVTTRTSNNGGSDGGTIYFDVAVGSQSIEVTSLLLNVNRTNNSNNGTPSEDDDFFNFEVYLTPDTASGKLGNIGQWVKVANGGGMPKFEDEYSLGALKNTFTLGPNRTYGVAIVFDDGAGHAYTNATGTNEVYSNSDLTITGIAASNSKFGSTINGRVFNGGINYDLNQADGQCLETVYHSNNGGNNGGMVYFDVDIGSSAIELSALSVNTPATAGSNVDIKLYRTPTTHVGKTGSSAGWVLVAEGSGSAAGQDLPTHIALNQFVRLSANTDYGLAIELTHDDGTVTTGHRYTNGNGLNESFSNGDLEMTLGSATNAPFGDPTPFNPRVFNGAVCYGINLLVCRNKLIEQVQPRGDISAFNSTPGAQEEADNFSMTNNWEITGGTFWATYSNTTFPPVSQDMVFRFFEDSGGLPGALVETRNVNNVTPVDTGLIMSAFGTDPSIHQFDVSFAPVSLAPGRYWISALGDEPDFTWAWARTNTTLNAHAVRVGAGAWSLSSGDFAFVLCGTESRPCYPDCDKSTGVGVLDIFDFLCFQDSFVAGESYACDCDTSTGVGVCDIFDFLCFQDAFVAGCP